MANKPLNVTLKVNSSRFDKWYQIRRFTDYSIDLDLESDADAFKFTISNPGGICTGLFSKFDPIIIEINDEPIMRGRLDCVEYDWDDSGSTIAINGRDLIANLIDNDATPGTHKNVKPTTFIKNKCEGYGIKASVSSSISTVEQLVINAGESEISVINGIVENSRKKVWFFYDTLHAGDWNDGADPTYLFTRGITDRPGIPIKSLKYREDGTDTKSMVKIYGSNSDGAEKVVGTAKNDYMIGRNINKREIKRASNDDSASKYADDAVRDVQDSLRDGMELTIKTRAGLGGLILPNKTAQVIDTVSKINATFFIVGVNYEKSLSGGSIVTITMIPSKTTFDKLWKNQAKTSGSLTGTSKTTISELIKEKW